MRFTRKQGWRGIASTAFATAILSLTAMTPANAQTPSPASAAKGGTTTVGTVTCNWTINIDQADVTTDRSDISIPVKCSGVADSIDIDVSYLDLDQNTVRSESPITYLLTSSATGSTSSRNDSEKWVKVCVQAVKGASSHTTCAQTALAYSPNRSSQWLNGGSGLCMGVAGGSGAVGASVVQFKCLSHKDQGWHLPWKPGTSLRNLSGEEGFITNYGAAKRCLGTLNGATANLTPVILRACKAANTDQIWLPVSAAAWGHPGGWVLENSKAGLGSCLGVRSGSTAGSAPLVVYTCNGHPDQVWYYGPEYSGS
jgi:Ricin-type beta-trefoil lectin domain